MLWAHLNKPRIPKKILNMKLKVKCCQRQLKSRWDNRLGYMSQKGQKKMGKSEKQLWKEQDKWSIVTSQPTWDEDAIYGGSSQ